MPQNFIACNREQELWLPPSLREWLPEDHFAWSVIDVVDGFDLTAFTAAYRSDGWGRAAHDPAMMVALIPGFRSPWAREPADIDRAEQD